MGRKALSMKKQQEIQRLKKLGISCRKISRALGVSRKTIRKHLGQAVSAEPLCPDWVGVLDWERVAQETRKGVSLEVLWGEARDQGVVPVGYSGFWKQFHKRYSEIPVSLHREFPPGERAEVDYAGGRGIPIFNPVTGETFDTELFVGVLCFSKLIYAEFSLSQRLGDWISSHVRMFEFWGGVPKYLCSDNLKSGVKKAHLYDPDLNPTYTDMAAHYGCALIPARPCKPRDKGDVERTVQTLKRWFYTRVRYRHFTSLTELNQCLWEHLKILNQKMHRRFKISRFEKFQSEKKWLKALAERSYEMAIYHRAKLHPDCHLAFDGNFYSAPHELRGKVLDVRATLRSVEIYNQAERVAFHPRKREAKGKYITKKEHYPQSHQAYFEQTPQRLLELAGAIGPWTYTLIDQLFRDPYPLRYLRRCQGIVRLGPLYGKEALEKVCELALKLHRPTYVFIEKVLKRKSYEKKETKTVVRGEDNPNLRGHEYFH